MLNRTPWIASLLVALGCASSGPTGTATPLESTKEELFPERPGLNALVPSGEALFHQETWGPREHCHEWGFALERVKAVMESAEQDLRKMGYEASLRQEMFRQDDFAVDVGRLYLDPANPDSAVTKLLVCSLGLASVSSGQSFIAKVAGHPAAPKWLGKPDLAWKRRYTTREEEIGLRWVGFDEANVRSTLAARDYKPGYRTESSWAFRKGASWFRMTGTQLWWQLAAPTQSQSAP